MKGVQDFLKSDGGNVESALVLIPLLVLVLSVVQLSASLWARDIRGARAQSNVTLSALQKMDGSDPVARMNALGMRGEIALGLSGGGSLYVGRLDTRMPSLTPLLPEGELIKSLGVAVGEDL